MRRLSLVFLTMIFFLAVALAQSHDSTTIGGATFDWGAPAPPLTPAQKAFFQRYKNAINAHDESALLALEEPVRSGCKYDGHQIIFRDFRFPIPENAKVRFFSTTKDFIKDFGFGDIAYLPVAPTGTFGVSFAVATRNHVSSTEILRPIRQSGDAITLIPNCLTEKGNQLFAQKNQSGK